MNNITRQLSILTPLIALGALSSAPAMASGINAAPGFAPADTSLTVPSGVNKPLAGITAPWGSFSSQKTGFAGWEKFTRNIVEDPDNPGDPSISATFSNMKKQYWSGGVNLNVGLSQRKTNSDVVVASSNSGYEQINGVDYYGRLTGNYDFMITGSADQTITSLVLQIKHSPYNITNSEGVTERIPAFTAELAFGEYLFSATGVESQNLGGFSDPIGTPLLTFVYEYRWENLSIDALSNFSISFLSASPMSIDDAPQGLSVDTIALHANTVVPEPATYALLSAAGIAALVLRRHLRRRSSNVRV